MTEGLKHNMHRKVAQFHGLHKLLARLLSDADADKLPSYIAPTDFPKQCQTVNRPIPDSDGPIFISARFRSGSTLLWQIFHSAQGLTSYYEPFNERRWFDPNNRGQMMDSSHRVNAEYWTNYEGLDDLGRYHKNAWTYDRLFMSADVHDSDMEAYISRLVGAAPGRPVLQFNRVDFRLPFLAARYPRATLVNLRRNPRDTWRSSTKGIDVSADWTLKNAEQHCQFYLFAWYRSLSFVFPQIIRDPDTTHPYEIHYLLSRLSDLFAYAHCHILVSYDELMASFETEVTSLFAQLGMPGVDIKPLMSLHAPRQKAYKNDKLNSLYSDIEKRVEAHLISWLRV